jgi:hypothetical protein
MKAVVIALVATLSLPVFAASEAECDAFVSSADAAGKRVGKPYPAAFLPMLKKGCLKNPSEQIAKTKSCIEKAKDEPAMQACNKKG